MKSQFITPLLVVFCFICNAQIKTLDSSVIIANKKGDYFQLNNESSVLEYIDESLDNKRKLFNNIQLDSSKINLEIIYYLRLTSNTSNRTLVKWLNRDGDSLFIGNSQNSKFKSLSQYFMCEGEASCYPRLMESESNELGWSCREDPACVSPEYSKEHPCYSTKALIW